MAGDGKRTREDAGLDTSPSNGNDKQQKRENVTDQTDFSLVSTPFKSSASSAPSSRPPLPNHSGIWRSPQQRDSRVASENRRQDYYNASPDLSPAEVAHTLARNHTSDPSGVPSKAQHESSIPKVYEFGGGPDRHVKVWRGSSSDVYRLDSHNVDQVDATDIYGKPQYQSQDTSAQDQAVPMRTGQAIAEKTEDGVRLCEEQQRVVDLVLQRKNVFYTGSGGCGKSEVLKHFVKKLEKDAKTVEIVGPTGIAALAIGGRTLHSLMGWTPGHFRFSLDKLKKDVAPRKPGDTKSEKDVSRNARRNRRRILNAIHILVFDEISMVENHVLCRMDAVMKAARSSDKPFGGVQVVCSGDFFQLPPVKPFMWCYICDEHKDLRPRRIGTTPEAPYNCKVHGKPVDADKWAFKSEAWKNADFEYVELKTIHRQADPVFKAILERCRKGEGLSAHDEEILLKNESKFDTAVQLYPTNEEVGKINMQEYEKLVGDEFDFISHDHVQYDSGKHRYLVQRWNADEDANQDALETSTKFGKINMMKMGMPVLLQINISVEAGLVNGSQGIIRGWEPYNRFNIPKAPKHPGDVGTLRGEHAFYREKRIQEFILAQEQQKWPVVEFQNGIKRAIYADCAVIEVGSGNTPMLLSRTQIPLAMGWAMTIHKSQGMTLEKAIIDLSRSWEEGQVYVALSRVKSLAGLKLLNLGKQPRANKQVLGFWREHFGNGNA